MYLHEALKTGKPIMRRTYTPWVVWDNCASKFFTLSNDPAHRHPVPMSFNDMTAGDWEVKRSSTMHDVLVDLMLARETFELTLSMAQLSEVRFQPAGRSHGFEMPSRPSSVTIEKCVKGGMLKATAYSDKWSISQGGKPMEIKE